MQAEWKGEGNQGKEKEEERFELSKPESDPALVIFSYAAKGDHETYKISKLFSKLANS